MTATYAPILVFAYKRPEHLHNLITSLKQNAECKNSDLIIYSDAASDRQSMTGVENVRRYIRTITGFASVQIIERETNWGLANSIIDGVSTQIERYGRVIVLEDDLIVAPYFLQFMNEALERYKEETRVGHIQACDFTHDPSLPEMFLIKWTGSWGWATWKRAWVYFNPNGAELLQQLEQRKLTHVFDFNGSYKFTRMLRRQIAGKNNSWAIRWNASLFLQDILSINVGRSLVSNNGFDGSGTNCGGGGLYHSDLYLKPIQVTSISPVIENEEARAAFVRYYHRTNNFWAKAWRRIKRTLKGDLSA